MHLGAMRRALTYTLQDPNRWDAAKGLVRRPFTIDMWDFEVAQADAPAVARLRRVGKPFSRHAVIPPSR